MQEKVYQSRIKDVDELRERIKAAWEELDWHYRYSSQAVAHSSSCMCQGKRRPRPRRNVGLKTAMTVMICVGAK